MYSCGPPHMDVQKQDDQHELTYSNYVRTRDVTLKTCRRRWMIGRSGERGSGISVLAARHDDDDDDSRQRPKGSLFDSLLHRGVREGTTPFPGLLHFTLDPYLLMLSVKQGGIKYHFLSLWYELFMKRFNMPKSVPNSKIFQYLSNTASFHFHKSVISL